MISDVVKLGSTLKISVRIESSQLEPEEFIVEMIILTGKEDKKYSFIKIPFIDKKDNYFNFEVDYTPESNDTFQYGIRVLPNHPALSNNYETGLVCWS